MPVFVGRGADQGPALGRRRVDRRRMDARLDAFDQVELPGAAFDLPGAQGKQPGESQYRQQRQHREGGRAAGNGLAIRAVFYRSRRGQGIDFMSCVIVGIMFVFM